MVTGAKDGDTPWSTIVIFYNALTVMKMTQYSDTHIVCVQVDHMGLSFYIVSAYFQFSTPIQPYLQRIRDIVHGLRGQKIVFCIDANAKSPMWQSQTLGEEGIMVEDLIQELGLQIINEPDNLSTFYTIHAKSNIDVTLATNSAANYIRRWNVEDGWISSERRAITFDVTPEKECETSTDVVCLAKNIRRIITETCKESIPLKRKGKHTTK